MKKRILAVDNSPSMRQMVKLTLSGAGYDIVEAGDGAEGLGKAQRQSAAIWWSPTSTCRS